MTVLTMHHKPTSRYFLLKISLRHQTFFIISLNTCLYAFIDCHKSYVAPMNITPEM